MEKNVFFQSLEKIEYELKSITQNFDSLDLSLINHLPGVKNSNKDKTEKVKLINEGFLNFLEPKNYEVQYEKEV